MTRSTEEPTTIELKRTKEEANGFILDLLVHWDAQQITVDEVDGESHQEWEYKEEELSVVYQGLKSEISAWLYKNRARLVLLAKGKNGDLTTTEKEKLVDYETGKAIDSRIHPASGVEEQVGILRYAVTELYNRLGETVPTELGDLNTIANEEIQNGQNKKANL